MSKATICGDAINITSGLTLKDIKMVEKYAPQHLVLKGGDDGKEELFAVCTCDGPGDIDDNGAVFGRATRDEDGFAYITMMLGDVHGDVSQYVADLIGPALYKLNKLEEQILDALPEVEAYKEAMMASIEVVQ